MRNKKLLWIFGMILVISSVMVQAAIRNPFRGLGGGAGSILYIVVNSILIGLFLFVLATLLGGKFFKAHSRTAKGVFVVVLVILSVYFAFQLGDKFIWSQEVVKDFWDYLFDENGILSSGQRLFVFIGGSLLFSWLFTALLKVGGEKHRKIDIALAILIGADLARMGVTKNMLIILGQIIALILLTKQFGEAEKRNKVTGFIWAFGLVTWISSIAFPGVGLGSVFSGFIRAFGVTAHIWYILLVVFLGLLVGGVLWKGLKKKEDEAKKIVGWGKNALQYIGQPFINLANKINWPIIGWLLKKADAHDITPGAPEREEFSFSIKKVWVELFSLLNYLLRLEVYYAKGGAVDVFKNKAIKLHDTANLKIYPRKSLHIWFDILKNGTGYEKVKGRFEAKKDKKECKEYINNSGEDEPLILKEGFYGKFGSRFIIFRFLEQFKKDIEGITPNDKVEDEHDAVYKKIPVIKDNLMEAFGKMKDNERRYGLFIGRSGARNVIDSYSSNVFNQLNKQGQYIHNYKFARKDAKIYSVVCDVDKSVNQPFGEVRKHPGTAADSGEKVKETLKHEVDLEGYFLEDIDRLRMEGDSRRERIRRVMFKDAIEHPDFRETCRWQGVEWDFFIKDIRDGRFHPRSRTVSDYTEMHSKKRKYNYRGVTQSHGVPGRGNAAFDREALKDIGRFIYWGRKNVDEENEGDVNVPIPNQFPAVTTIGLTTYISDYIDEFGNESAKKQKKLFIYETGRAREKGLFIRDIEEKGGS